MRFNITELSISRTRQFLVAAALFAIPADACAQTIEIGIGTQNTTTNTVTGGVVLKELGLLEKHLPKTGKYKDVKYSLNWQNFTSGPPITNGMMANNIQIGMMGDYPLMVNGATGQATRNETQLVAVGAFAISTILPMAAETASSSTRIPPYTNWPISRERTFLSHSGPPRMV